MKVQRLILIILFVLSTSDIVYAQTQQEADLQTKYWNYRNRLKRDFSVIGFEPGHSVVMTRHEFGDDNGYFPFVCGSHGWGGVVEWGDAVAHHGTYLSLLATEYKLLKNNNQPTDGTLIELYYAIAALSRMDKNLDTYFKSSNSPIESGVLVRDDMYIGIEKTWNFLIPDLPTPGDMILKSMAQATHRDGDCTRETFRKENIWSKDHIANVLYGLCMVKKMVDNPYVKPLSTDKGFYIQDEIARIVDIWMTKFSKGHAWQETLHADLCGDFTVTESINWFIMNDITNEPVGEHAGGKLGIIAWPLNEMARYITGNDYARPFFHLYDNPSVCIAGVEQIKAWKGLMAEWDVFEYNDVSQSMYQQGHDRATSLNTLVAKDYLSHLNRLSTMFPLAAVSGLVDHEDLGNLTKHTDGTINPYAIWELSYSQFNNVNSIWTKSEVADVLALAPMCTNPANGHFENQLDDYWIAGNNAIAGLRPISHSLWGYYNGMDYMLMYNLYRLQFSPNPDQEGGYSESSCECDKSAFKEIYDNGGNPMFWPAHAFNKPSPLTTSHTVRAVHPKYKEYENNGNYLKLFEYLVRDLVVAGSGKLTIETDYKISNEVELKIENGGIVSFEDPADLPKTIYITEGSVVKIASDGRLKFGENALVIFQKGSVLDIEAGGELILSGNAKLFIEHDAVMKCGSGIVNMAGIDSKIIIRGLIRVKSNETFKPIGLGTLVYDNNTPQTANPTFDYNLVGEGSGSIVIFENIKIQVLDYTFLYPSDIDHIEIDNCTIKLGLNAYLNIGSTFSCSNSTFDRMDGELGLTHYGLVVYGQDGIDPLDSRVKVQNCNFQNGQFGIRAYQNFGGGKAISVLNNTFTNLGTALFVYDEGLYAFGNTFSLCNMSIVTNHSTAFVNMESNKISGDGNFGHSGTQVQGDGFRSISAGNVFKDLGIGFGAFGGSHGFICNSFVNNIWGVTLQSNGLISWSDEIKNGMPIHSGSLSWLGSGFNLAYVNNSLGSEHFIIEGSARLQLRNGYNTFDLNAPFVYYTSGIVERSKNISTGYLPIDIDYSNNLWANYAQPPVPHVLFENVMNNSFFKINMGFNSINHGTLYPDIIGTQSTTTLTCPVSAWDDAHDYSTFQPGQNPRMIYFKKEATGGLINPYGPVTGNVGGGIYVGQNIGTAVNTALPSLTEEIENGRFKVTSVSDLMNFGDLAGNIWELEDNWSVNEEILNDYIHFVISFLKQPTSTQPEKQMVLSQLEGVIDSRDLWLTNSQQGNVDFLNSQLVEGRLLLAQVYRVAKEYSRALSEVSAAYPLSSEITTPLINHYYCLIDNERMNNEGAISNIEFVQAISACQGQLDAMRVISREKTLNVSTPVLEPTFTYLITPNPVSNTLNLSFEMDQAIGTLTVTIVDSYGNQVYFGTLTELPGGPIAYQVDLSSYRFGIYHVIVSDGSTNVSKSFILNG